jgi:hypothetical protein
MTPRQEADAEWGWLYRIGGIAALILASLTLLHAAVFSVVGLPADVVEWFALFDSSPIGGLLAFEILMVLYVVLSVPVVLALYVALHRGSPSLMAIYLALSAIGIVSFIVARPAFEMLALSQGYAVATGEVQRSAYLAAGEATIATFNGTTFWVSYLLGSIGGLVVSAAILRTAVFSRATAYLRIASSVLDFGLFIPGIGLFISLIGVFCLLGFNLLIARRLLQLGHSRLDARATSLRPSGSVTVG